MVDMWLYIKQSVIGLRHPLYPSRCALCDARGSNGLDLCSPCCNELPWNHLACPRCALALPGGCSTPTPCAGCQQIPPPYDQAWSAFRYDHALRWLHRRFKFGKRLAHSRLLGQLLVSALAGELAQGKVRRPDCICVMPLHRTRLMRRGFNQSLELIRPAARQLQIELDYLSLRRIKPTQPQSQLPADKRRDNVAGAFISQREWSGQHVALFDDVVTTGETVAEAARILKKAGAHEISVWSLARTPTPSR